MELSALIKIQAIDSLQLHMPYNKSIRGKLVITDYHTIIIGEDNEDIHIPHKKIDSVQYKSTGAYAECLLKLKDFTIVKMSISSNENARLLQETLAALSNIENIIYSYAFRFHHSVKENHSNSNGGSAWNISSIMEEFSRRFSYGDWRVSNVNCDFKLCPSYPSALIVPVNVSDEEIMQVAKCRDVGRIPLPVYCDAKFRSVLLRSSQPLGVQQRRCKADQNFLNSLLPSHHQGHVKDVRTEASANIALLRGGGYEIDQLYPRWKKTFMELDPPSKINESFRTFIEGCVEGKDWTSTLAKCDWFQQIHSLLTNAYDIAVILHTKPTTVLVHGQEGTDNTLQLTSLVQVILDPDARTILGFEALIDREWLNGGHKFADRCSKGPFNENPRQESPIFLQFIDCVWQILQQHPSAFQFNSTFLLTLCRHVYYSEYGTFMCNNHAERQQYGVYDKTTSLWSYINQNMSEFMNPLFAPSNSLLEFQLALPSRAPQSRKIWRELYLRQIFDFSPIESLDKQLADVKEDNHLLKIDVNAMRKLLKKLLAEEAEQMTTSVTQ